MPNTFLKAHQWEKKRSHVPFSDSPTYIIEQNQQLICSFDCMSLKKMRTYNSNNELINHSNSFDHALSSIFSNYTSMLEILLNPNQCRFNICAIYLLAFQIHALPGLEQNIIDINIRLSNKYSFLSDDVCSWRIYRNENIS